MDQSKGEYTDLNFRSTALTLALQANAQCNGDAVGVIEEARDFYLFLTGKDPVLDRYAHIHEESEESEENVVTNVISLREFLRTHRNNDD